MSSHSWNTDGETPDYEEMSTISTPSESTVRRLADDVRGMDISDERVFVDFDGLIPESHTTTILDQLMFDIHPPQFRAFGDGDDVVFSARETIQVEGEGDVYVRAFVSANDGDVMDVELTAYPA